MKEYKNNDMPNMEEGETSKHVTLSDITLPNNISSFCKIFADYAKIYDVATN